MSCCPLFDEFKAKTYKMLCVLFTVFSVSIYITALLIVAKYVVSL